MRLRYGLLLGFVYTFALNFVHGKSPYEVLGLSRNADQREIKRSYKKLAREWHPDRSTKKEAQSRFVEIADAYQILSDPKRRRKYDLYGEDTPQRQQQQRHPFSGNGDTFYFYQSADGSRHHFQGDPFEHFSQDFFRSRRREPQPQEPLGRRIWNKLLSSDGLTSWVLTLLMVGAVTGIGALVRFFDTDEKSRQGPEVAPSHDQRKLPTDKLVHEMNMQTYYGLLKLQKPGCRTVLLLTDGNTKRLVDQFADTIYPYKNSRTLAFAYMDLDKYFHWYLQLLRAAGLVGSSVDIQKKQCLGTVLVLNNFKRCFFLFHSKATKRVKAAKAKENCYGFSDSSDAGESDVESGLTHRKHRSRDASLSQTSSAPRNKVVSLDGLSTWLERVFDGQGTKLTVDQWPELTKYG